MYFITIKRMLEVCFSAHPNIQYRTYIFTYRVTVFSILSIFHYCPGKGVESLGWYVF